MATSQDALTFGRGFIAAVNTFLNDMNALNTYADRIAQDAGLAAAVATAMNAVGRPTLTTQNINDAVAAIGQVAFTLNSGSPTQKSKLYALL